MSDIDKGGSAFPGPNGPGMTRRQYLATKAMQGLLANPQIQPIQKEPYKGHNLAKDAFGMADALIRFEKEGG